MWPASWSCIAAAACLLQVVLPLGEPAVVNSLLASCFASALEDEAAPAPAEDADDELPSAIAPHRTGLRRLCSAQCHTPCLSSVPSALSAAERGQAVDRSDIRQPDNIPLRC